MLDMSYDFSRITERLFVGSQIHSEEDISDLRAAGVTHIIDCCEVNDSIDVEGSGIALLWDATADDGKPKTKEWFSPGIDFGVGALSHPGFKVHCHCVGGVNRGPSMAYAILRAFGLDGDAAFNMIKRVRPEVEVRYRADADLALKALRWL